MDECESYDAMRVAIAWLAVALGAWDDGKMG